MVEHGFGEDYCKVRFPIPFQEGEADSRLGKDEAAEAENK
jgi:hypothetical protein